MATPKNDLVTACYTALCALALITIPVVAHAEDEAPSATPFRPTVTSGAAISAPGWLELEFGGQRLGGNGMDARNSWPYLLKYSFNDRYALLLGGDSYVATTPAESALIDGPGDTTLTLKYKAPGAPEGVSYGLEATMKFPTAADGLGSGERDYSLKGIYGFDMANGFHLDTNLTATRMGSVSANQGQYQWTWATALSRQVGEAWTLAGDLSGTSQSGAPATAQFLAAASYAVNKRLVVDAGFANGLNKDTPKFTVFAGLTVLIGKIY
jgi:hypothetical protein